MKCYYLSKELNSCLYAMSSLLEEAKKVNLEKGDYSLNTMKKL